MKILLITLGSAGDVHPLTGLALALKNRGHDVTLATSGFFRQLMSDVGINFIELGNLDELTKLVEDPDVWNPKKGLDLLFKKVYLPAIQQTYEIIESYDPKDTVVASSIFIFGARIAHEKLKTPLVTIQLQPASFWSVHEPAVTSLMPFLQKLPLFFRKILLNAIDRRILDRILAPEINSFLKELNLAPVSNIFSQWANSPQKILGLFPDWFGSPPPDWPAQTELTGFVSFDGAKEMGMSQEMISFLERGEPPIIFTPGTAMRHGEKFFKESIDACLLLKKRAVLLTIHKEHVPQKLPEGIAHFDYIPFSLVLPHAAALVHHGGIGTVSQALAAGIPQLIMPMNFDQPDNAWRLGRLGAGLSLAPAKYRSREVAKSLKHLLHTPGIKENCRELSAKIDFSKSMQDACSAIERMSP